MNKYEQFYINGEWVNPVNKLKTLDVINPATEDVIGSIAMGDSDDVDAAVKLQKMLLKRLDKLLRKRELKFFKKLLRSI